MNVRLIVPSVLWTPWEGIDICRMLEAIAPRCGAHIALTGGLLYKDGPRKDLDIVVYRIRQEEIDYDKFFSLLQTMGIEVSDDFGFVVKARMGNRPIDFLFPEHTNGDYSHDHR
jgi:hypothetical protein